MIDKVRANFNITLRSVTLFVIFISTGIGSFFSYFINSQKEILAFCFVPVVILLIGFALPSICSYLREAEIYIRIIWSVMALVPLGLVMGICYILFDIFSYQQYTC